MKKILNLATFSLCLLLANIINTTLVQLPDYYKLEDSFKKSGLRSFDSKTDIVLSLANKQMEPKEINSIVNKARSKYTNYAKNYPYKNIKEIKIPSKKHVLEAIFGDTPEIIEVFEQLEQY